MEKLKIALVAQKIGVSTQAVYKKLAKVGNDLQPFLTKKNGITYFNSDGVDKLSELFGKPLTSNVATVGNQVETIDFLKETVKFQQETINQLIAQNEEERKLRGEERQRTDTILLKLSNDVSTLQKALEYRKVESAQPDPGEGRQRQNIKKVWKDPLEGMSLFQKILIKWFRPEQLRQHEF
ncbi:MAG: hypothetical protein HQM08_29240 [Candidatus Riflebacteria bacterium]|nr:hypothetical protein [Candidatus Riflebacteria bacterium]